MTRVASDRMGLLENAARDGRIARARSVARAHNPHGHRVADGYPVIGAGGIDAMLHAWWRGWDQADRELTQGTAPEPR